MSKVCESRVYLNFIRRFALVLGISALLGVLAGLWWDSQRPKSFGGELQLVVGKEISEDRLILTDQLVGILRSRIIIQKLNLDLQDQITVHKNGPQLVLVFLKNPSQAILTKDLGLLSRYIETEYPIVSIEGLVLFDQKGDDALVFILGGASLGLTLGLLLSLGKLYLERY